MQRTTSEGQAQQLLQAITVDLSVTTRKQQQCGEAMRAVAAMTLQAEQGLPVVNLRPSDIASLFAVLADQALLLATEAQDYLKDVQRLCA